VFDINEHLDKFLSNNAPVSEIVKYYVNFIPYYSNLFSQLFVFISVIFFTTKLAENSEIIAMMSTGVSFPRLMRPYMISAAIISILTFILGGYIIPKSNVERVKFENTYRKKIANYTSNVQLEVDTGVIAYLSRYENSVKTGYDFTLDKYINKKLVSHLHAAIIQYDSLSESPCHWIIRNYQIRDLQGMREKISYGSRIDSVINMEPQDLIITKGQQQTMTNPELRQYIDRQKQRGFANIQLFEVEYWQRGASSFASFILTIIGASLSSRKRKGGMGSYLGLGLVLSFVYIMLQTVSSTFAINAGAPPMLAAWTPNIIFAIVAYFCYRNAPN
jgi:lipopolysaccharide export system permease protein